MSVSNPKTLIETAIAARREANLPITSSPSRSDIDLADLSSSAELRTALNEHDKLKARALSQAGTTQAQIAKALGVSVITVRRILSGAAPLERVKASAGLTGLSVAEFAELEGVQAVTIRARAEKNPSRVSAKAEFAGYRAEKHMAGSKAVWRIIPG
jgi:hypothetical protein